MSMVFTGTLTDYLKLTWATASTSISTSTGISMLMWIKSADVANATQQPYCGLGTLSDSDDYFMMQTRDDGAFNDRFQARMQASGAYTSSWDGVGAMYADTWFPFLVVKDASADTFRCYVNTVAQVSSIDGTATFPASFPDFTIGVFPHLTGLPMPACKVAEVCVWRVALSTANITNLLDNVYQPDRIDNANIADYWAFSADSYVGSENGNTLVEVGTAVSHDGADHPSVASGAAASQTITFSITNDGTNFVDKSRQPVTGTANWVVFDGDDPATMTEEDNGSTAIASDELVITLSSTTLNPGDSVIVWIEIGTKYGAYYMSID